MTAAGMLWLVSACAFASGARESPAPKAGPALGGAARAVSARPGPGRLGFAPPRRQEPVPGLPAPAVTGRAAEAQASPAAAQIPAARPSAVETQPAGPVRVAPAVAADLAAARDAAEPSARTDGSLISEDAWRAGRRLFDRDGRPAGEGTPEPRHGLAPSPRAAGGGPARLGPIGADGGLAGPAAGRRALAPPALPGALARLLAAEEGWSPERAAQARPQARATADGRLRAPALGARTAGQDAVALLTLRVSGHSLVLAARQAEPAGMRLWTAFAAQRATEPGERRRMEWGLRDAPAAGGAPARHGPFLAAGAGNGPNGSGTKTETGTASELRGVAGPGRGVAEASPLPWAWLLPFLLAALRYRKEFL